MARLPSTRYLVQQIGGKVILFEDHTEREIVRFDPAVPAEREQAQDAIDSSELTDEDKVFAHFWAGYFGYYAGLGAYGRADNLVTCNREAGRVVIGKAGRAEVVKFDPSDQNATAQAQKVIYDSELTDEDKRYAYFWSGFFYAQAA